MREIEGERKRKIERKKERGRDGETELAREREGERDPEREKERAGVCPQTIRGIHYSLPKPFFTLVFLQLKAIFSCCCVLRSMRQTKDNFTVHTGLHSILEATLVPNIVKNQKVCTIRSTKR